MNSETLFSMLALAVMGYVAYRGLKRMVRSGHARTRADVPLSPADLAVLEESATRLVSDLNAAADACVAKLEQACAEADRRIAVLGAGLCVPGPTETACPEAVDAFGMVDSNQPSAEVAKQAGMTTGEVELLRGLRAIDAARSLAVEG